MEVPCIHVVSGTIPAAQSPCGIFGLWSCWILFFTKSNEHLQVVTTWGCVTAVSTSWGCDTHGAAVYLGLIIRVSILSGVLHEDVRVKGSQRVGSPFPRCEAAVALCPQAQQRYLNMYSHKNTHTNMHTQTLMPSHMNTDGESTFTSTL